MKSVRRWLYRIAGTFGGRRAEQELAAELESHLQLHIDDNLRAGMSPDEARRQALVKLGGVDAVKEAHRERRGLPAVESLLRDLRYGLRTLRRSPGFAAAAVVILGLGIGVNSAIFTVVNAVVLQPLPFADADRLVRLWHTPPQSTFPGMRTFSLSPANFLDWEAQSTAFDAMAIYRGAQPTLTGQGEPTAAPGVRASASFLPIFGLTPIVGRGFTAADDRAGAAASVLLSERLWRTRFGADPSVVGRTVLLNQTPTIVLGVVPTPSFLDDVQMWLPLGWGPTDVAERADHNYRAVARLRPGVPLQRAQAELDAISLRLAAQYPAENKDWGALVVPLQDDLVGDAKPSLLVLLGAVALVLLIACANLANLLLVRTHGRAKEIALRGALGASRGRVVQQLLAEGLLLGLGGGLAGFAAAVYGVNALVAVFGAALPRAQDVAIDGRVLAFTAAISTATGMLAAFFPAWRLSGRDAHHALKQGATRGSSGGRDGRLRQGLVVSEVALALMLLVGAGLLMRSLASLRAVDPGFDPANVLTASVGIPMARYDTELKRNQFFAALRERLASLPAVTSAAHVESLPFQGGSTQYVTVQGAPPLQDSEKPTVAVRLPSPGYFATMRIPLLAGRDFTAADAFGAPGVVVVSQRTAERFWPGENPLGKRIALSMMSPEMREVVGVVGEIKMNSLDAGAADSETALYAPAAQFAFNGANLVLRTTVPPESLAAALVGAVRGLDAELPVLEIQPLQAIVDDSLGQRPTAMWLLAVFAALALALASVGVYSVLAYTVRQRVREIGIRMALGAPSTGVLRMVVLDGLKPTIAGVVLGLGLSAGLVSALDALLFGVSPYDPGTFTLVAAIVVAVGLVATLVPAWRATRVDPIVTLRAE